MTLETRRYNFSKQVTLLKNEADDSHLEIILDNLNSKSDFLKNLVTPMRKHFRIYELLKELENKGLERQKNDALVKELEMQQSDRGTD